MTRQEAIQTLQVYTKSPTLIRHHLAVEITMRTIARYLSTKHKTPLDEEAWALVALLHDADYELTRKTPKRHTLYLEEKIGKALSPEVMYAIKSHAYKTTGIVPQSAMDWALYTCDELTGFVIATSLSQKEKRISTVTVELVMQKMKDLTFAKNVDRGQIMACEQKLGIPLAEYTRIVLSSMQSIAPTLGFE